MEDRLYSQLLDKVIYFISYRDRSVKEVIERLNKYLLKKNITREEKDALIQQLLTELQELKLLDDEKFANTYVRSKTLATQPIGKVRLRQELQKKGVSRSIIESVLAEVTTDDEKSLAERLLNKKLGTSIIDSPEKKSKLIRYLLSRGFSYDIVCSLVDSKYIVQ